MAYALVGSAGAVASGTTSVAPAFPQVPTAGNLLIAWAIGFTTTTGLTINQGWTLAKESSGSSPGSADVFWKIATASETAPTISQASGVKMFAQIAEFSGNVAATPVDKTIPGSGGTSGSNVSTAASADTASGELVLMVSGAIYSAGASKTTTLSLNNGTLVSTANNDASAVTGHYRFGYAITTTNASADSSTFTYTTTNVTGSTHTGASMKVLSVGGHLLMLVGVGS